MKTKFELVTEGPFPGRMDVWAEHEHYFHGLHEQLIGLIIASLREPLFNLGYVIGRETSLQMLKRVIPDLYIRDKTIQRGSWPVDYPTVAGELLAEVGVRIDNEPDLTAITIYQRDPYELVTMLEVVSPGNKNSNSDAEPYLKRRDELIVKQGVNIVEIDITRSYKHLFDHAITRHAPYHVAIYIPGHGVRVVPMGLQEPFKRIALPLREHVLPLDLAELYQTAYQQIGLADLMLSEGFYALKHLPFAALLTQAELDEAMQQVQAWQAAIQNLNENPQ